MQRAADAAGCGIKGLGVVAPFLSEFAESSVLFPFRLLTQSCAKRGARSEDVAKLGVFAHWESPLMFTNR